MYLSYRLRRDTKMNTIKTVALVLLTLFFLILVTIHSLLFLLNSSILVPYGTDKYIVESGVYETLPSLIHKQLIRKEAGNY
jgi:hypothetical protein